MLDYSFSDLPARDVELLFCLAILTRALGYLKDSDNVLYMWSGIQDQTHCATCEAEFVDADTMLGYHGEHWPFRDAEDKRICGKCWKIQATCVEAFRKDPNAPRYYSW